MSALLKFSPRYRADNSDLILSEWKQFSSRYEAPDWLQALRVRSAESLSERGLPTPKLERFKYTNIPAALKKMTPSYAKADVELAGWTDWVSDLQDNLQKADIRALLETQPVSEDKYGDMMLWDVSNLYTHDGFVVDVPANIKNEDPLSVTIIGHDAQMTHTRNIIHVQENSELTLIEYQTGDGHYWSHNLTQITLEKGAKLRHYRFQKNDQSALYTGNIHITVEEGGHYDAFTVNAGGKIGRDQRHVDLRGRNAEAHINGINVLSSGQANDTTLTVEHHAERCISKQNYRSVLDEQGTATFQGKIHVHQEAQQTDGYQLSNSLLLSPQATMNTKPELEIYADDVKCSHGATSGMLDKEALFYLRSRGMPEKQAKALLVEAFLNEIIDEISSERAREETSEIISRWLEEHI